jgi:hypothetical protein
MAKMESKYVNVHSAGAGKEGKIITDAQAKFEAWMKEKNLNNLPVDWPVDWVVDRAPYVRRGDGYQGTAYVTDLVIEYLENQPDQAVFYNELQDHAVVIGEVSDLWGSDRANPAGPRAHVLPPAVAAAPPAAPALLALVATPFRRVGMVSNPDF